MREIRRIEPSSQPVPARKRAAAYARVSSSKDAQLQSLSAQVSYYSNFIQKRRGWEYAGVYADEALTGTKDNRPEFQRLMSDCRDGKIDIVITNWGIIKGQFYDAEMETLDWLFTFRPYNFATKELSKNYSDRIVATPRYRAFRNHNRLSFIMALSSCFEMYRNSVVALALESRPGSFFGLPSSIDYRLVLKKVGFRLEEVKRSC